MSVCIVGNAPYYHSLYLGEWIDSHDTVIRFNNYELGVHAPWVGSKTDIWTIVQNPWNVVKPRDTTGIKQIMRVCNRWPPASPEHFGPIIGLLPCITLGPDFIGRVMTEVEGKLPSSGCLAVYFAVHFLGPCHVTGFSHFSTSKRNVCLHRLHYFSDGMPENVCHDGQAELRYFDRLRDEGLILKNPF